MCHIYLVFFINKIQINISFNNTKCFGSFYKYKIKSPMLHKMYKYLSQIKTTKKYDFA